MNSAQLEVPAGQNWSCHGCSQCCRSGMAIPLYPADRQRLDQQRWTKADGVDPATMIVQGLTTARLGLQADGACVFLDAAGRCRIHAKFGEAAKPLACRLYPLVVHPAGKKLLVGLRFSCPSAAANRGQPLKDHAADLAKLARVFLPAVWAATPPPAVAAGPALDWPDFRRFVRHLDETLAGETASTGVKLLRALHWLGKVEQGKFDQISGDGAEEILGALTAAAAEKIPRLPANPAKPSGFGRLFLRLMVLENARSVTVADVDVRSAHRWKMLAAALRCAP